MSYASGAQSQTTYVAESTWGTTPAGSSTVLPVAGNTIKWSRDSLQDRTLRSDRQLQELRTGSKNVAGDLTADLRFGDFDSFLESALMSTWGSGTATQDLTVGSTQKFFSIEKGFTDIARYHVNTGCIVKTFSMSVKPNSLIPITFSMVGKDVTKGSTPIDASPTAASTNDPFDSFTGSIYEGGTGTGDTIAIVTGIDFTLENSTSILRALMNSTGIGIGTGRSNLTGTLTAYFENATLLDKFFNETESSVAFTLTDSASNSYTFTIPALKYTGGDPGITDENEIILTMPFQAYYDSSSTTNFKITRTV